VSSCYSSFQAALKRKWIEELPCHLFDLSPGAVCAAVKAQRQRLKQPPMSAPDILQTFLKLGLSTTVAALEDMVELI
jgi:hypothetical protein